MQDPLRLTILSGRCIATHAPPDPQSEGAALADGPLIANLSISNVEYADAPLAGQVRKLREAFALREDTAVTVATLAFGGLQL